MPSELVTAELTSSVVSRYCIDPGVSDTPSELVTAELTSSVVSRY